MNDRLRIALPLGLAVIAAALALPLRMRASDPRAASPPASSSSGPPEPVCPPDVVALVAGPPQLGAWSVARFHCVQPRRLDLELARGETHVTLTVAAEGAISYAPPAHAGGYALFYGNADKLAPAEITTLLDALAARITNNRAPNPKSW